jgi:uncharacterized delta-60 repeat protein
MAKTWGIPGKRQTFLSPGEQIAKMPKVPLNANPLESWDYKKSRYQRIDLYPKAVSENTQQGGVIPVTSGVVPDVTPTPTPSITPTNTITPTLTNTPTNTITPTETLTPTVTMTPSPTPAPCFESGTGFDPTTLNWGGVLDGTKYTVGANFTSYNSNSYNRLIRLNNDGSVDNTFNIGTGFSAAILSVVLDNSSKYVIGGDFLSYSGLSINRFIRLNTDGSIDNTLSIGTGFNFTVRNTAIQSDNKIIAVGGFSSYSGVPYNRVIRLNDNGSIDDTFNSGGALFGFNQTTNELAIQPDGKIIFGGAFTTYSGVSCNRIVRLNTDGSIDNTFVTGTAFTSGGVNDILLQSDGKIMVGGSFATYSGASVSQLIRLNSNGSQDFTFTGTTTSGTGVRSIVIQPDGKYIIAGGFGNVNGVSINKIARLNSDGSTDNTFNVGTGFNGTYIDKLILSPDGKVLCLGNFTTYNGFSANGIILLNSDGSVADCPAPTPTPTTTPTPTITPTITSSPAAPSLNTYQFRDCSNPLYQFIYENIIGTLNEGDVYDISGGLGFNGTATVIPYVGGEDTYDAGGVTFTASVCPPYFDADAQAFLDEVIGQGGTVDATISAATNTLYTDIKIGGLWGNLIAFYPYVGGVANAHSIDGKSLSFPITFSGGWTHNVSGATPNGTDGWAESTLTTAEYITYESCLFTYLGTTASSGLGYVLDIGWRYDGGTSSQFHSYIGGNECTDTNSYFYMYGGGSQSTTLTTTDIPSGIGAFAFNRTSDSVANVWVNGVKEATNTNTITSTLPGGNLRLPDTTDGFHTYSPRRHQFDVVAQGLTDTKMTNLFNIVNAYQTSLGRNVY